MHNEHGEKTTGWILSGLALHEPEREAPQLDANNGRHAPTVSEREVIIDF